MNESTLESFINYCDEMQIAEEEILNIEKISFSTKDELKKKLIETAKANKFTDKNYNGSSQTYGTGDEYTKRYQKINNALRKLDLGFCISDPGGNYIVYSFTRNKFYFFDHERDGLENIKNDISIDNIIKHIESFKN